MTEQLLHLQRWIKWLDEREDGWHCRVGYTITKSREETVDAIQSTPLAAARFAYKLAKALYEDRKHNYYLKRGYVETDTPFRAKGVYEYKKNGHVMSWHRHGWHCEKCDDIMLYPPSDSSDLNCPGVKRYRSWDDIPENLKTPNQLYELGYSKGKTKLPEAEGAIAWKNDYKRRAEWQWVYLYPVEKAVKRHVSKSQEKALQKAHRAKGSTLEIIKAVAGILPPDYTVISEYKQDDDEWGRYYYTLKIQLKDMVIYDRYLRRSKKRSIEIAIERAKEHLAWHELYQIIEPLLDWKHLNIRIWIEEGWYEYNISICLGNAEIGNAWKHYLDLESAKQNITIDIEEMKKELS